MSIVMDFVAKYKERVDRGIAEELEKRLEEVREISPHLVPILQAMKELSVGGKRLRALLTILGYQIGGGSPSREDSAITAGVVMELFHLGLLIQDDFMDRDGVRRGVATIQTRYDDLHIGESVAVCAGDFTYGWGMEVITSLKLSNSQIVGAMRVWGKYFTRVGYGQTLDVLKVAEEESLLQILSLKSGEYSCVLPLQLGAALGGGNGELMESLYKYGTELGWVFQLRDDYLSEWGESTKTGKPVGNDGREGKHSFALLYGREKTQSEIARHMQLARGVLSEMLDLPGPSRQVLEEIVTWVGTREN